MYPFKIFIWIIYYRIQKKHLSIYTKMRNNFIWNPLWFPGKSCLFFKIYLIWNLEEVPISTLKSVKTNLDGICCYELRLGLYWHFINRTLMTQFQSIFYPLWSTSNVPFINAVKAFLSLLLFQRCFWNYLYSK